MQKTLSLIGKGFGRWIVLEGPKRMHGQRRKGYLCKCICGNIKLVSKYPLLNGTSQSCGCLRNEVATVHGKNRTYLQRAYQAMKQRCLNFNNISYKDYGGRGITICERWLDKENGFVNFLKDMGERPSKDHSLDRIDNDGNYTPENCQWSTYEEQNRNNRQCKLSENEVKKIRKLLNEDNLSQRKIAKIFDISHTTICNIKNNKIQEMDLMRGFVIGRYQPFHNGHLEVIQEITQDNECDELIIGIGSAQESHTLENPFTAGERILMIDQALIEVGIKNYFLIPIIDLNRYAVWVAHVESLVPTIDLVYTNNPLTKRLFEERGYKVKLPKLYDREKFSGTKIREMIKSNEDWTNLVPPAVEKIIKEINGEKRIQELE